LPPGREYADDALLLINHPSLECRQSMMMGLQMFLFAVEMRANALNFLTRLGSNNQYRKRKEEVLLSQEFNVSVFSWPPSVVLVLLLREIPWKNK